MEKAQTIVVIHQSGQLSSTIARSIRDENVYSEVLPYTTPIEQIREKSPVGIILPGDMKAQEELQTLGIPILNIATQEDLDQIHSFIFDRCHAKPCWTMDSFIEQAVEDITRQVGGGRVLAALSGGVDSMVVAALVHRAIGDRLTCVLVDHGLMRKNECEEVVHAFESAFTAKLIVVNASDLYFDRLQGVSNPEQKRKIIGSAFIEVFEAEAKKLGSFNFLAQGTIYPDVIESGMLPGDAVIKSHHNVGGLPENMGFSCVEPLRMLFKDEVRRVGIALGLPEHLVYRQPFPGPGLGVRVVGEITRDKVAIVREADAIFRQEVSKAGLSTHLSQYFAALLPFQTIGIHNGMPSDDYVIALRAVKTTNFVSATWAPLPNDLLLAVSNRITDEMPNVGRVVFDITDKPPAPIEWE